MDEMFKDFCTCVEDGRRWSLTSVKDAEQWSLSIEVDGEKLPGTVARASGVDQYDAICTVVTAATEALRYAPGDVSEAKSSKALELEDGATTEFATTLIGFDPFRFTRTIAAAFTAPGEIGLGIDSQKWGNLLAPLKMLSLASLALLFLVGLGNNIETGKWWLGGENSGTGFSLKDPDTIRLILMVAIPSILTAYVIMSGYRIRQSIKQHYTGLLKVAQALSYTLALILIDFGLCQCLGQTIDHIAGKREGFSGIDILTLTPFVLGILAALVLVFWSTPSILRPIFDTSRRQALLAVIAVILVGVGGVYVDLVTHKTIAQEALDEVRAAHPSQ